MCWTHIWFQHSIAASKHASIYRPKPAATPDIIMFHDGSVDCVDKQDQTVFYFKIPDKKYAVGDSVYHREPGKIVCIESGHDDEFKEFILGAKNRQESLDPWLCGLDVLSHCLRHDTRIDYHQTCVHAVCNIV